jgi:hypothetical protein
MENGLLNCRLKISHVFLMEQHDLKFGFTLESAAKKGYKFCMLVSQNKVGQAR